MIFNLVQIAANGTALPKPRNIGLYGPVILISRQDYEKAGGHRRVKSSVVDDMALGSGTVKSCSQVAPHLLCKPRLRWLRGTGAKPAFAPLAAN